MQLSPNELIKLLAETERIAVENFRANNVVPKEQKRFIKVAVRLKIRFNDDEGNISWSYNEVIVRDGENPVKKVMNAISIGYYNDALCYDYDPVKLTYRFYNKPIHKEEDYIFEVYDIRDCIIDKIEL